MKFSVRRLMAAVTLMAIGFGLYRSGYSAGVESESNLAWEKYHGEITMPAGSHIDFAGSKLRNISFVYEGHGEVDLHGTVTVGRSKP